MGVIIPFVRSLLHISNPVKEGSVKSRRIRSIFSWQANRNPSSPSLEETTLKFSVSRKDLKVSSKALSSSTISIFFMALEKSDLK
jgi:hypothetical protein